MEISATQEPRQADVGDVCAGEHDALETGTVEADDGGDVVVGISGSEIETSSLRRSSSRFGEYNVSTEPTFVTRSPRKEW